jgi:hypothetical protein
VPARRSGEQRGQDSIALRRIRELAPLASADEWESTLPFIVDIKMSCNGKWSSIWQVNSIEYDNYGLILSLLSRITTKDVKNNRVKLLSIA